MSVVGWYDGLSPLPKVYFPNDVENFELLEMTRVPMLSRGRIAYRRAIGGLVTYRRAMGGIVTHRRAIRGILAYFNADCTGYKGRCGNVSARTTALVLVLTINYHHYFT